MVGPPCLSSSSYGDSPAPATESLLLIIALATSNADIQKLLAFEGAFDKLFAIVRQEGGIGSGGIVVQDCLAAIAGLLRWNVSNQVSFLKREAPSTFC